MSGPPLPVDKRLAPRWKFRGKRRYFRRVHRRAEAFRPDQGGGWYNLWHYHADWHGVGNLAWRYRFEHLRALATVFKNIHAARPASPFQAWILVSGVDAGHDAVYLHTPNPHTPFPCRFDEALPATGPLLDLFQRLLPDLALRMIAVDDVVDDDGKPRRSYCVWAGGLGVSLSTG